LNAVSIVYRIIGFEIESAKIASLAEFPSDDNEIYKVVQRAMVKNYTNGRIVDVLKMYLSLA
jgi:hypothetical protein